jgi:glutamate-1-semialdehyde 2,1-aminomutase
MSELTTEKIHQRAQSLIPGGGHTYSKGDDQFPANAPKFIAKGKGCRVWDTDGRCFLDLGMSLGTVVLGHAYEPVLDAVRREIENGVNFVRPTALEGEVAEILTDVIPGAEMVKFAKHGSDAVTGAIKLARAFTGRKYIVRCASDPFNAVHDWFIGSTIVNRGVPVETQSLTLKFDYNDLPSLERQFNEHPGEIACVVFEPISMVEPDKFFLESVKKLCEKNNALLIFDEVVSGFRFALGGVQEKTGVVPHLGAFGKAMANGFSVSALVGQRPFMNIGGITHESERVFLLSTTHGGETHSLAACRATINELKEKNVVSHFYEVGGQMQEGMRQAAKRHGMDDIFKVLGYPCKPACTFKDSPQGNMNEARTLFLQETIKRGLLMPYIVPSYSHKASDIQEALQIVDDSLRQMAVFRSSGSFRNAIVGPVVKPVFRKFN